MFTIERVEEIIKNYKNTEGVLCIERLNIH